jgi:hypothetical protein
MSRDEPVGEREISIPSVDNATNASGFFVDSKRESKRDTPLALNVIFL